MFSNKGRLIACVTALMLVLVLLAGCAASTPAPAAAPTAAPTKSAASSAADFYKGKIVNIIVPYSPGGGFDQYPRLAQPALEAAMPGTAVVVQNITGAGGIVGSNAIYRAAPDGLTVGIANIGGMAFAAATGAEGVEYDLGKLSWIGRANTDPRVVVVSAKGNIKSIADLKKLGRPALSAATGVGSDDYYMNLVLFKALGIPFKMITGFTTSMEADLSILRGDSDCEVVSLTGVRSQLDAGELMAILFVADAPVKDFEKVPLAKDQGLTGADLDLLQATYGVFELERSFIGPPGIPADRLEYLRAAFNKAFSDPTTLAMMEKAKRPVNWLDGKTCESKIQNTVSKSQLLKDALKALTAK